jgi:hypothetical protein
VGDRSGFAGSIFWGEELIFGEQEKIDNNIKANKNKYLPVMDFIKSKITKERKTNCEE